MDQFRLLVVKPSSIGDIVHGLQVVSALKNKLPHVSIDWVVRDVFAPVVACSGIVDSIIPFARKGFGGLGGFFNCCRRIGKSGPYDAAWDMQGLLRSAIMARCAHTSRRIGRSDGREFSTLFYDELVPMAENPHAVEILSQFLPTLSLEPKALRPIKFTLNERPPVDLPSHGRAIVIAPESRGPGKEWPHYETLTANLCGRFPHWQFLWVGLGKCSPRAPDGFENFCDLRGKTSLGQLLAIVDGCSGTIANDSACMHIAAAMAKPVLGIFLRTDPLRCGPYPLAAADHFVAKNPPAEFPELDDFLECVLNG